MSLDQFIERWQLVMDSKATDSRPNSITARKPSRTIKATPIVRRLRQLRFLYHRLRKTNPIEIPETRDKRQQQPDAIALVDHQRLLAVTIVVNNLFRWRVADFERIKKKR